MLQFIVNRYEIHEELGVGGMGTVYRGIDTQTGEQVAIKLLKPEIVKSNLSLVERFDREGQILRQLNHPNIVKMLGTVIEGDRHYIIMEYVGGGSLQDLLNQQEQLPIDRVLEIALDIADALTRAHRLKVIHRDIKPANVLLGKDGSPLLTDFGVAHIEDRTHITETGALVGTYTYISPEACRGEILDDRTDIWSFGVMLYKMLTGVNPYDKGLLPATITAILQEPIPDVREYRPDVPPVLADLISRMLEKDRDIRIPSVRQVGAELEAIIRGLDISSMQLSTPLREVVVDPNASRFATPTPEKLTGTGERKSIQFIEGEDGAHYVVLRRGDEQVVLSRTSIWMKLISIAVGLLLIAGIVSVVRHFLNLGGDGEPDQVATVPAIVVEPVAAGEYMVLVAQAEHLGGAERDVSRFIANDLTNVLETGVPFSKIRIREYPEVIISEEQAESAALATGATVVVWGNYDDQTVTLNVQMGTTDAFPMNKMPSELLKRTANIQVQMSSERAESAAPQVLGVLAVLQSADGDGFEYMRTIAILESITVSSAAIVGDNIAAHMHRYFETVLQDANQALAEIETVIEKDPTNPIAFALRGIVRQRLGMAEDSARDAETAARLGPENWTIPYYLSATGTQDFEAAISSFSRIIDLRPDDWAAYTFRGMIYYEGKRYDLAKLDLERAIDLGATVNTPYIYAALIAMREARVSDSTNLMETVIREFPDPTLMNRIMTATFGEQLTKMFDPVASAFGRLALGQYAEAIAGIDPVLDAGYYLPELYLMKGLAQCSLNQYAEAEAAFTTAITLDPSFGFVYMLRADARRQQGNLDGADADLAIIEEHMPTDSSEFSQFFEQFKSGEIGCDDIM